MFFADLIKKCLCVAMTFGQNNLIHKILEVLCAHLCGKEHVLVLYSKSRWLSINYMIQIFIKTKAVLVYLPASFIYHQQQFKIDESISMHSELTNVVTDHILV